MTAVVIAVTINTSRNTPITMLVRSPTTRKIKQILTKQLPQFVGSTVMFHWNVLRCILCLHYMQREHYFTGVNDMSIMWSLNA